MTSNEIIEQILNADKCGDIFEKDALRTNELYRSYIKIIHPDVCQETGAEEATIKLNKLYKTALNHISKGTWEETGVLQIGSKILIKGVKNIAPFELGARYVSDTQVAYIFDSGKDKYRKQYILMAQSIKYKDSRMRDLYLKRMPVFDQIINSMTADRTAVVIKKPADSYPMDLFLKAYSDQLTGRDIAWMISRMCDLLCFLHINTIVLNGFTKENLFISPKYHELSIFGGWWYAVCNGDHMIGTNRTVYNCMPTNTRTDKIACTRTDIESMRYLASELTKGKTDIPKPILDWINAGSSNDPIQTYKDWNIALDAAYGARKFVVFEADPKQIYRK